MMLSIDSRGAYASKRLGASAGGRDGAAGEGIWMVNGTACYGWVWLLQCIGVYKYLQCLNVCMCVFVYMQWMMQENCAGGETVDFLNEKGGFQKI